VVSAEPLLGPADITLFCAAMLPAWIIAGPQTGPGAAPPEREWVDQLIHYADARGVPLWLKSGCYKLWPDLPLRQELPADRARVGGMLV